MMMRCECGASRWRTTNVYKGETGAVHCAVCGEQHPQLGPMVARPPGSHESPPERTDVMRISEDPSVLEERMMALTPSLMDTERRMDSGEIVSDRRVLPPPAFPRGAVVIRRDRTELDACMRRGYRVVCESSWGRRGVRRLVLRHTRQPSTPEVTLYLALPCDRCGRPGHEDAQCDVPECGVP